MQQSIEKRFAKNAIATGMGQVPAMVINFFLIPYIILKIGLEQYGVWVIAYSVIGFIALLDFGVGDIYPKFVAEYRAKGSIRELNGILSTGFVLSLIVGLLLASSLFFRGPILSFFNFEGVAMQEAQFVLTWVIIIFVSLFILGIFHGILWGIERLVILNTIDVIAAILNAISTILFLEIGLGLKGLILSVAIYSGFAIILKAIFAYKLIPGLSISPFLCRYNFLKIILTYSSKIQITKTAGFVIMQIDKILIGHYMTLALVGFYDIGATVARAIRRVPMFLFPALLPAASALSGLGDKEKLYQLFLRISKYVSLITMPLLFFIIVNSDNLTTLWMGKGYEKSVLVLRFLVIGFMLNVLTGPGTTIVRGIGRPGIESRYTSLLVVTNFILSLILLHYLGFIGAVLGTCLSMTICSIYFIVVLYQKVFEKRPQQFFSEIVKKPGYISISMGAMVYLLNGLLLSLFSTSSRPYLMIIICINGVVFVSGYFYWIIRSGFLTYAEIQKLYMLIIKKR